MMQKEKRREDRGKQKGKKSLFSVYLSETHLYLRVHLSKNLEMEPEHKPSHSGMGYQHPK